MLEFVLAMHLVGAVPASASHATWEAATTHGVDPYELGAYLVSEHGDDWTPDTDRCSDRNACGPFQLVALWPRHFGYPVEARTELEASADIAAQVLAYSHERHADCYPDHDWRAHMKCSRVSRSFCVKPVERWQKYECGLREANGMECDPVYALRMGHATASCPARFVTCPVA